jgi:hypothetical protein
METFTLYVLLVANVCGPPPPIAPCGMPRPLTQSFSKAECEQKRQETLKGGDHAYCVSDTRESFTLVLWLAKPDPKTGGREMRIQQHSRELCEDALLFHLKKNPDMGGFCSPDGTSNAWWIKPDGVR